MKKKLGIVTDTSQLDEQDTFFPFVNEAIKRPDLDVYVFDTKNLSRNGKSVLAKRIVDPIFYETKCVLDYKKIKMELKDFDMLFLKKDPPVDKTYLRFLKLLIAKKIPAVNNPKGIIAMGTKAYLKRFRKVTPKTFYVHSIAPALKAIKKLKNCVLKQSDSYGGKGVTHLSCNQKDFYGYTGETKKKISKKETAGIIRKYLQLSEDNTLLAVKYLKSAGKRGDKRVIVIEGEKILGSYIRLPNREKGICICANSGARKYPPTKRDLEILKNIKPFLKKNGIQIAALDLLKDDGGKERLSEINVVNPGFCNLDVVHPELHIARRIIDMIEKRMKIKH